MSAPILPTIQSAASTAALAEHTFKNFYTHKDASRKESLTSKGVRLVNLACSLLDTYTTYDYPRYYVQPPECGYRFQWRSKWMSDLERLTDPVLTRGLKETDGLKCPYNYSFLADPNRPTQSCKDFNPLYKSLAKAFHPDHNGDPRADGAMTTLTQLKEFYCK